MKDFLIKISLIIFCFQACQNKDNKVIENPEISIEKNRSIEIYNSIFDTILKTNLAYAYLGEKSYQLLISKIKGDIDSLIYLKAIEELQDNLVTNKSLRREIYLFSKNNSNNSLNLSTYDLDKYFDMDDIYKMQKILESPLSAKANQLQSNLVNLKDIDHDISKLNLEIDSLYLSEIYISKNSKYGILCYGYICGPKCGQADLIILKLDLDEITIEKTISVYKI